MTDAEKVEAVNEAYWLGSQAFRITNSRRGWSPTAAKREERSMKRILTAVLGRKPTDGEVDAALAD